jgi:hypothetical protein
MDLYPEAFAAAGLVNRNNPVYRLLQASQRAHAPDAWICLGEGQARAVMRTRGVRRPIVILPCGVCDESAEADEVPEWRRRENRLVIAYAGNLGEAHCPELLPALVEAADPETFAFRFAVYGASAARLRERLEGRTNIAWCKSMSHRDLALADVHAASLRPNWMHVCVPSKAVTTVCLGRPLIFAGDPESDTARMLGQAAWIVSVPGNGRYDRRAIEAILRGIADPHERRRKREEAVRLSRRLRKEKEQAIANTVHLIAERPEDRPQPV